MIMIMQQN